MPVQQPPVHELILPDEDIDTLEAFAAELGVAEDFDLLLMGDGSGGTYRSPAGWGCIAYDREQETATMHSGALTAGTVNLAELMPYVHALWHYHVSQESKRAQFHRVGIVSDSQVTVRCGNGEYRRKANGCLWASIRWFESQGYILQWHHVTRNSNEWNELADWMADRAHTAAQRMRRTLRSGVLGK